MTKNASRYIESGVFGGKGSDAHKAAVTGDTVPVVTEEYVVARKPILH